VTDIHDDEDRWWSVYLSRAIQIEVDVYGEPQSLAVQTFHLPPGRSVALSAWRAEAMIPIAEVVLTAVGPTEEVALTDLIAEVQRTWEARINKQRGQPPVMRDHLDISHPEDVHLNEPWLSIHWDRDRQYIHADWKGFCSSPEFRAGTLEILEAIRARNASALISDNRELEGVSTPDQLWLRDIWVPEAVASGIRWIAVVVAHHGLGKVASTDIISKFGETEFVTRTFESPHDAADWVTEKGSAKPSAC
jgi:hypothetical protein